MDSDQLISKTLQRIRDEKIKPEPSWKLCLHNYLFWSLFLAMVGLAAVSFAMVFRLTGYVDWDIYKYIKKSRVEFFFSMLPYFWILLLVFFAIISYYNIRRTRRGYRYNAMSLAAVSISFPLGLGILIWLARADESISHVMQKTMPYASSVAPSKEKIWNQPEMGLLSGSVVSAEPDRLHIIDQEGRQWEVLVSEKTIVRPVMDLDEQEQVRIIGTRGPETCCIFEAAEIRPWDLEVGNDGGDNEDTKTYDEVIDRSKPSGSHQNPQDVPDEEIKHKDNPAGSSGQEEEEDDLKEDHSDGEGDSDGDSDDDSEESVTDQEEKAGNELAGEKIMEEKNIFSEMESFIYNPFSKKKKGYDSEGNGDGDKSKEKSNDKDKKKRTNVNDKNKNFSPEGNERPSWTNGSSQGSEKDGKD